MTTTFLLVTEESGHLNVVTQSGELADMTIPYAEQPCCPGEPYAPFGEHAGDKLFSLFTADIIQSNTLFTR